MSLLKEHILRSGSVTKGHDAFMEEVAARHNYVAELPTEGKNWVRCRWKIDFRLKVTKMEAERMRARLKQGDTLGWTLETYHLLGKAEAKRLALFSTLRSVLLPLATFGTLTTGFLLVCLGGPMLAMIAFSGLPKKNGWVLLAISVSGGLIFAGCIKAQLFLRKVGRPPDTDDFNDERLKLIEVAIIP